MSTKTNFAFNLNYETEVIERDILYLKNIAPWSPDLIKLAEEIGEWVLSTEIVKKDVEETTSKRTSDELLIASQTDPGFTSFESAIYNVVGEAARAYVRMNPYFRIVEDSGYSLLRYKEGHFYGEHIDWTSNMGHSRVLSILIYLNDDYEGGGIVFPRQDVTIKPEAGSVVVFPSVGTHPHEALEVTKGTKYAVVTWMS